MIELRTLGTLDLRDESGNRLASVLAQPKRVALLAYLSLAAPRGIHRRDTLLGLFWPELPEERARGALNQAVYVLRRALGARVLHGGADGLGVEPDLLRCDAVAFTEALRRGEPETALDLYGGDLLRGFYVEGAPGFERWLEEERAGLQQAAVAAARTLAAEAGGAGSALAAASWLRRALSLAPLDESLLLDLMAVLSAAGDRAGALREYEGFAARLMRELDLEPAPETFAAAGRLRTQLAASRPAAPTPAPIAPAPARVAPKSSRGWRHWMLLPASLAALVLVLGFLAGRWPPGAEILAPPRTASATEAPETDRARVLVLEFQNETADPAPDPLGRLASDWISQELAASGIVDVVPEGLLSRRPYGEVPGAMGLGHQRDVAELAERAAATIVVSGTYYRQGDSVAFNARVTDATSGLLLRAVERVAGPGESPLGAVDELRKRITGALATLLDPRLASWADAASQPPSFEAYQGYVDGLDAFFASDYRGAARRFRAAAELDPAFTAPLIWAIRAHYNGLESERADSLARHLETIRHELAPWDRAMLDYNVAEVRANPIGSYRAMKKVVDLAPGSEWAHHLGAAALYINRPAEAAAVLTSVDPDAGWLSSWRPYWSVLLSAHHARADYEQELLELGRMRRRYPNAGWLAEARALAGLGRVEEAVALARAYMARTTPSDTWHPFPMLAVLEVGAHGGGAAADRLLTDVLAWLEDAPEEVRRGVFNRATRAQLLLDSGRDAESRGLFETLLAEQPNNWDFRGALGVLAARAGDREEALRISREIEGANQPYHAGEDLVWCASIAAALGDLPAALEQLREAYRRGLYHSGWLHIRPDLAPLRSYPPFQELMRPKG